VRAGGRAQLAGEHHQGDGRCHRRHVLERIWIQRQRPSLHLSIVWKAL
jgi:hypothetical protein